VWQKQEGGNSASSGEKKGGEGNGGSEQKDGNSSASGEKKDGESNGGSEQPKAASFPPLGLHERFMPLPARTRATADGDEHIYGYSNEIHEAYKEVVGGNKKKAARIYAPVYCKEGADDNDFVFAKFPGEEVERQITDITVGEWKVRQDNTWENTRGALWAGSLDGTAVKLMKSVRGTDESVVVLQTDAEKKRRQLCQIFLKHLKGDKTEQRQAGIRIGTEICNKIVCKAVAADMHVIAVLRDEMLAKANDGAGASAAAVVPPKAKAKGKAKAKANAKEHATPPSRKRKSSAAAPAPASEDEASDAEAASSPATEAEAPDEAEPPTTPRTTIRIAAC